MREYEVVHEILNECARNQMRDIFIEEIEIPEGDFENYIRSKHKDHEVFMTREDLEDGSVRYTVETSGIIQKYTFT
ncbi:MAG: hypothetical protein ACI4DV_04695 [Lachnospiraceae bacterium]